MRRREKVIVATLIVPLAAFTIYVVGVSYYISKPKIPTFIPYSVVQERLRRETTFATENDIETRIQLIGLKEIVSETTKFSQTHLLHLEFGTSLIASSYKIRFRIVSRFYPLWSNMSTVFSIGSASVVTQRRRH